MMIQMVAQLINVCEHHIYVSLTPFHISSTLHISICSNKTFVQHNHNSHPIHMFCPSLSVKDQT